MGTTLKTAETSTSGGLAMTRASSPRREVDGRISHQTGGVTLKHVVTCALLAFAGCSTGDIQRDIRDGADRGATDVDGGLRDGGDDHSDDGTADARIADGDTADTGIADGDTADGGGTADARINYVASPPFASTDWVQVLIDDWDTGRAAARPMPNDLVRVRSPYLVWPHVGTNVTRYQVNLRRVGGPTVVLTPDRDGRNWLNPGTLMPGDYQWQVQHPSRLDWSDWRPFTIAANAVDYQVPSAAAIVATAAARPHPRSLPDDLAARLVQFRPGGALRPLVLAAIANLTPRIGDPLYWEGSTRSRGELMRTIVAAMGGACRSPKMLKTSPARSKA